MALADELERAAAAAAAYGPVTAVLAAEPVGRPRATSSRSARTRQRRWLVLDAAARARRRARAGARGRLDRRPLRARRRARGRRRSSRSCAPSSRRFAMTEQPPGIEEAEEAALALEQAIGAPPVRRLAGLPRRGRVRPTRAPRGGARRPRLSVCERARVGVGHRRGVRGRGRPVATCCRCARVDHMEGGSFAASRSEAIPEDLLRGLREFAEQQAESVQEAQREQFATLTLNTAVELTSAALSQVQVERLGRRAGDRPARRDARPLPRGGRSRQRRPPGLHARAPLSRRGHTDASTLSGLDKAIARLLPAVPKPIVRRLSSPYIAGPTLDDAVRVVRRLNGEGKAGDGRRARRGGRDRRRGATRSRAVPPRCSPGSRPKGSTRTSR